LRAGNSASVDVDFRRLSKRFAERTFEKDSVVIDGWQNMEDQTGIPITVGCLSGAGFAEQEIHRLCRQSARCSERITG
jgi:hypothetical protein